MIGFTTGQAIAALGADLERRVFAPTEADARRIGVEVELIPVELDTRRVVPPDADAPVSTLRLLRHFARASGWRESVSSKGAIGFDLPDGGHVGFEPGGQIEYATPPCETAAGLLHKLRETLLPVHQLARRTGIDLMSVGIDPINALPDVPLQLVTDRYCLMAEYFGRIGPAGGRMMRQTAAFQITLDTGDRPLARWKLLNALAPYFTAIFANSPIYARRPTGHQSYRAHGWRCLDPARTGLAYGDGTPSAYLEFALRAPDMMRRTRDGTYLPFIGWLAQERVTWDDWHTHLSTLFPEVRPRGTFELRALDALDPDWYAAPIVLATGLVYHEPTAAAAQELLGEPDSSLLGRAATAGLHDPKLANVAAELARLGIAGCAALGPHYCHVGDFEQARTFFERYTFKGRAPADEAPRAIPSERLLATSLAS